MACRRLLFNTSPSKRILKYIGCSPDEYRNYINSKKFADMTEYNFGTVWQLDHIVPVELFDLTNENDLKVCFNYLNVFPMYSMDNKAKGMSIHFSKLLCERLPNSDIRQQLIERCQSEIDARYSKYLK